MASPFSLVNADSMFGRPLTSFSCVHCGEPPCTFVSAALKEPDHDHACSVFAYALCSRCASLFWDEAGERFFAMLKRNVCGSS